MKGKDSCKGIPIVNCRETWEAQEKEREGVTRRKMGPAELRHYSSVFCWFFFLLFKRSPIPLSQSIPGCTLIYMAHLRTCCSCAGGERWGLRLSLVCLVSCCSTDGLETSLQRFMLQEAIFTDLKESSFPQWRIGRKKVVLSKSVFWMHVKKLYCFCTCFEYFLGGRQMSIMLINGLRSISAVKLLQDSLDLMAGKGKETEGKQCCKSEE